MHHIRCIFNRVQITTLSVIKTDIQAKNLTSQYTQNKTACIGITWKSLLSEPLRLLGSKNEPSFAGE
jgi:hypothetical protein